MSSAVVYFNQGTACYIRLVCSIYSLRRHYQGRIRLIQEGEPERGLVAALNEFGVEITRIPPTEQFKFLAKACIGRHFVEDECLYLDSDTIVRQPIDEMFEHVREHRFVATWFNRWRTERGMIAERIRWWSECVPDMIDDALNYGKAINSGVYAISRDHEFLPAYEQLTRRGVREGVRRLALDEVAFQILLPRHSHHLMDETWNVSGSFGNLDTAKIVHFHGNRHCRPENDKRWFWLQTHEQLMADFPGHRDFLSRPWGDVRLIEYQREVARLNPAGS